MAERTRKPPVKEKAAAKSVTKRAAANPQKLQEVRAQIDGIDRQIQELISQRATWASKVRAAKGELKAAVEYYRPERESQILRRVLDRNLGPLSNEVLLRLFREIMSACLAQQEPLKVGFLGPEGTFSQQALHKHFGHSARSLPLASIEEVFQEIESGNADFGVVPIENSTEGSVNHTLDRFLVSPLQICGEVELRIHQNLMGNLGSLRDVKRVCSHPQSLAQCRQWLKEHLPEVELIAESSNAEAARRARDEKGTAAIAGETAAEVYDLSILSADIEDRPDNTTRFLVIGRRTFGPSGNDRTTLLLSTGHTEAPGALHRLLEPLAKNRVSLTRIESRPSQRRKWDYVFFIDLEGHASDAPVARALAGSVSQRTFAGLIGLLRSWRSPRALGFTGRFLCS